MSGRWKVRVWNLGVPEVVTSHNCGATVEVVTPEGHVAQLSVTERGEVLVRAWLRDDLHENGGGNRTAFSATGTLVTPGGPSVTAPSTVAPAGLGQKEQR